MSGLINELMEELLPMMTFMLALAILIGCMPTILLVIHNMKVKEDDEKAEIVMEATVLSKTMEESDGFTKLWGSNYPIEWVIFECRNGNRVRLRNVKINEILLSPGDEGLLVYRGKTIYQFIKR